MQASNLNRSGGKPFAMPNSAHSAVFSRVDSVHNDFIPHPSQFPIRYRRTDVFPWSSKTEHHHEADIGLSFVADKHVPAGTTIELEIPLRGESQRFTGTVVMVRELTRGFEIGLWLRNPDDAQRARIVERICHAECYLRSKQRT